MIVFRLLIAFWLFFNNAQAMVVKGAAYRLQESIKVSKAEQIILGGWYAPTDLGYFSHAFNLDRNQTEIYPLQNGIYHVSAYLRVESLDEGIYNAKISINDAVGINGGLYVEQSSYYGVASTLRIVGLAKLSRGDHLTVVVGSNYDSEWLLHHSCSLFIIYVGTLDEAAGAHANLLANVPGNSYLPILSSHWTTTGNSLFKSLTGFQENTGQYLVICDGMHYIMANLILSTKKKAITVAIYDQNGTVLNKISHQVIQDGINSISISMKIYLSQGQIIYFNISSPLAEDNNLLLRKGSDVSIRYFDHNQLFMKPIILSMNPSAVPFQHSWLPLQNYLVVSSEQDKAEFQERETKDSSLPLQVLSAGKLLSTNITFGYFHFSLSIPLSFSAGFSKRFQLLLSLNRLNPHLLKGDEGLTYVTDFPSVSKEGFLLFSGIVSVQPEQFITVFIRELKGATFNILKNSKLEFNALHFIPQSYSAISKLKLQDTPSFDWYNLTKWENVISSRIFFKFNAKQDSLRMERNGFYHLSLKLLDASANVSSRILINNKSSLKTKESTGGIRSFVFFSILQLFKDDQLAFQIQASTKDNSNLGCEVKVVFLGNHPFSLFGSYKMLSPSEFVIKIAFQPISINMQPRMEVNSPLVLITSGKWKTMYDGKYHFSISLTLTCLSLDSKDGAEITVAIIHNIESQTVEELRNVGNISQGDVMTFSISGVMNLEKDANLSITVQSSKPDTKVRLENAVFSVVCTKVTSMQSIFETFHQKSTKLLNGKLSSVIQFETKELSKSPLNQIPTQPIYSSLENLIIAEPCFVMLVVSVIVESTMKEATYGIEIRRSSLLVSKVHTTHVVNTGTVTIVTNEVIYVLPEDHLRVIITSNNENEWFVLRGTYISIVQLNNPETRPAFISYKDNGINEMDNFESGRSMDWTGSTFIAPVAGLYIFTSSSTYNSSSSNIMSKMIKNGISFQSRTINTQQDIQYVTSKITSVSHLTKTNRIATQSIKSASLSSNSKANLITQTFSGSFVIGSKPMQGFMGYLSPGEFQVLNRGLYILPYFQDGKSFQNYNIIIDNGKLLIENTGLYLLHISIEFTGLPNELQLWLIKNEERSLELSNGKTHTNGGIAFDFIGIIRLSKDDQIKFLLQESNPNTITMLETSTITLMKLELHYDFGFTVVSNKTVQVESLRGLIPLNMWSLNHSLTFKMGQGFSPPRGAILIYNSGVYLFGINLILSAMTSARFTFQLHIDGKDFRSMKEYLYLPEKMQKGFSFSRILYLQKWQTIDFRVAAEYGKLEIKVGGSLSFHLLEPSAAPFICDDPGLILLPLTPSTKTALLWTTVIYTCQTIDQRPADCVWWKNGKENIHSSLSSNKTILSITNATLDDSGNYTCICHRAEITATTNTATLNVIDPRPNFESEITIFSVEENSPNGTVIGFLKISTPDENEQSGLVEVELLKAHDPSSMPFAIEYDKNSHQVTIFTAGDIDFEKVISYGLHLIAVNIKEPLYNATIAVTITVEDLNDNKPKFNTMEMKIELKENSPIGQSIFNVTAVDQDSISVNQLRYYILNKEAGKFFALNNTTGLLTVKVNIDHEKYDHFVLNLQVYDGVNSDFTEMKITIADENDNRPIFDQLLINISISESMKVGEVVTNIVATDKDSGNYGNVSVSIVTDYANEAFKLSPDGTVRLRKQLDYENGSRHYNLSIEARDGLGLSALSQCLLSVRVLDANDNPTRFEREHYEFNVPENTLSSFGILNISDADKDINNGILEFAIESNDNNTSIPLQFNSETRELSLISLLDREKSSVLKFNILVKDLSNDLTGMARIIINVIDVNDNPPTFDQSTYNFNIFENSDIGSVAFNVKALDKDSGSNSLINYSINTTSMLPFRIVNNGSVLISDILDREKQGLWRFTITAKDLNYTTAVSITVEVLDVNDNYPSFKQEKFSLHLHEGGYKNHHLINNYVTDVDMGANGNVSCFIDTKNTESIKELFLINNTNHILVNGDIDREAHDSLDVLVSCSDHGKQPLTSTAILNIHIIDVNDNDPIFIKDVYNVTVNIDAPIGKEILTVTANDRDIGKNGYVGYRFYGHSKTTLFNLTSNGKLILAKHFGLQFQTNFTLKIQAFDNGNISRNSSTNAKIYFHLYEDEMILPKFEFPLYRVNVSENAAIGEKLLDFNAAIPNMNRKKNFTYEIQEDSASSAGKFEIKSSSLVLAKGLDYEKQSEYTFTVSVFPSDQPSRKGLTVVKVSVLDINDNIPVFKKSIYSFNVSETLAVGSLIGRVRAEDIDSGNFAQVYYILQVIPSHGVENITKFYIESQTGDIVLKERLDRESEPFYMLNITANDVNRKNAMENDNYCLVNIAVLDENDEAPIFDIDNIELSLAQDSKVGTVVHEPKAFDKDFGDAGKLTFRTVGEAAPFVIENQTGKLIIGSDLRREKRELYNFFVVASDGGNPSRSAFQRIKIRSIKTNVHRPILIQSSITYNVRENMHYGYGIGQILANDPENNSLYYFILDDTGLPFKLDDWDGNIRVTGELDYEVKHKYEFHVNVSDKGIPPLMAETTTKVTVDILDINDWSPTLDKELYKDVIPENFDISQSLMDIITKDNDSYANQVKQFELTDLNGNMVTDFKVTQFNQSQTWKLFSTRTFDYETIPSYKLVITAKDGGKPPRRVTAIIELSITDVNEFNPQFRNSFANISLYEDSSINSNIFTLNAYDNDTSQDIAYSIKSGNEDSLFSIGSKWSQDKGEVKVLEVNGQLDREAKQVHTLTIEAKDNGSPIRSSSQPLLIQIYILDVNDNSPQFGKSEYQISVLENVAIGSNVIEITAEDRDIGLNGMLIYQIESSQFQIDNNGMVRTQSNLDYEKIKAYNLTVKVKDLGNPQLHDEASLLIEIEDVNDMAPIFQQSPYILSLQEDTKYDTVILTVKATDYDTGLGGVLNYEVIKNDENNLFEINTNTGDILCKGNLQRNINYTLQIVARDNGVPILKSNVYEVIIVVLPSPFVESMGSLMSATSDTTIEVKMTPSNYFPSVENIDKYWVVIQEVRKDLDLFDTYTRMPPITWYAVMYEALIGNNYLRRYIAGEINATTTTLNDTQRSRRDIIEDENNDVIYLAGVELGCKEKPKQMCNGPLQPGKKYRFQLMAFFKGSTIPIESSFTKPLKTGTTTPSSLRDDNIQVEIFLIVALSVLAFIIFVLAIVIVVLIYRFRRETRPLPIRRPRFGQDSWGSNMRANEVLRSFDSIGNMSAQSSNDDDTESSEHISNLFLEVERVQHEFIVPSHSFQDQEPSSNMELEQREQGFSNELLISGVEVIQEDSRSVYSVAL